jgi:hypothetical protein
MMQICYQTSFTFLFLSSTSLWNASVPQYVLLVYLRQVTISVYPDKNPVQMATHYNHENKYTFVCWRMVSYLLWICNDSVPYRVVSFKLLFFLKMFSIPLSNYQNLWDLQQSVYKWNNSNFLSAWKNPRYYPGQSSFIF